MNAIQVQIPILGSYRDRWGDDRGVVGKIDVDIPILDGAERPKGAFAASFEYLHGGDAWASWQPARKPVDVDILQGVDLGDRKSLLQSPFRSLIPSFSPAPSYSVFDGDPSENPAIEVTAARARMLAEELAVVDGRVVRRNDGPLLFVTRMQDKRLGYRFLDEPLDAWDSRCGTTFSAFDHDDIRNVFRTYRVLEVTGDRPSAVPEGWDQQRARCRIATRMLKEIGRRLDSRLSERSASKLGPDTVAAILEFRQEFQATLLDSVSAMMSNPLHGFDYRSTLPGSIGYVGRSVDLAASDAPAITDHLAAFRL